MDNFHIDIKSEGHECLKLALQVAFNNKTRKVVGYRESKEKGLILYWSPSDKMTKLPAPLDINTTVAMIEVWLAAQDRKTYEDKLDHDGDNGEGWHLYNESWGHLDNEWEAFLAIKPCWAWYGK